MNRAKRIGAVVILLLALCPAAWAQTVSGRGLFTLEVPESWLDYGYDTDEDVEDEYTYDLGLVAAPGVRDLNLSMTLFGYPEYADVRLFDAEEQEIEDFVVWFTQTDGVMPVEVHRAGAYDIPFLVYRWKYEQDEYVSAATLANGWLISLTGYAYSDSSYAATRSLTDDDIRQFMDILDTFEPTLKGNAP